MGMSASQARLLSITARMTNNELESQLITNSKIRLATKSEKASDEYMAALNKTTLNFRYYNNDGEVEQYALTPALIYSYSPLKAQYAVQNSNGVNLVSAQDAKNYAETDNLYEFLDRYDCVDFTGGQTYANKLAQYNKDYAQYVADKEKYDTDYAKWQKDYADWEVLYNEYLKNQADSQEDLSALFANIVGTSESTNKLYCYGAALSGDSGCYLHLLNHLIDFDGVSCEASDKNNPYKTSLDDKITIGGSEGGMGQCPELKKISDAMDTHYCDQDDSFLPEYLGGKEDTVKENLLDDILSGGGTPDKKDLLKSDYIINEDGTYSVKTLKQKAIDLYYLIANGLISDAAEMRLTLINFTEGDMRGFTKAVDPGDPPQPPVEPTPPTKPTMDAVVIDKEKAQWYTNLWYMMNGSETANLVKEDDDETVNGEFVVEGAMKSTADKQNYRVLEESKLKDPSWLQYALESGIVSLIKTQYTDPGKNSGKTAELEADCITWQSVTYNNTQDIYEAEDSLAITKAQAKYEKTIREIEAKDNEYDTQLKNLDTIHNALKTEYESVKNVIGKNVERSFKAFS